MAYKIRYKYNKLRLEKLEWWHYLPYKDEKNCFLYCKRIFSYFLFNFTNNILADYLPFFNPYSFIYTNIIQ